MKQPIATVRLSCNELNWLHWCAVVASGYATPVSLPSVKHVRRRVARALGQLDSKGETPQPGFCGACDRPALRETSGVWYHVEGQCSRAFAKPDPLRPAVFKHYEVKT